MKVIPVVNCGNYNCARNLVNNAAGFLPKKGGWIHIDVVDGKFAPNVTWGSPDGLKRLISRNPKLKNVNFEIHLMVNNPDKVAEKWFKAGAKRVIVHVEAAKDVCGIARVAKKYKGEVMPAIVYLTSEKALASYGKTFKSFQVLAVKPGFKGQKFNKKALDRIKFLRRKLPNVKIEVDGGINPETAKLAKKAGADIFASASYIFKHKNPKQAFKILNGNVKR